MQKIRTVTVLGASGTMGANVAGIFASFGDAKVFCVGRDIAKVKNTLPRIIRSVKSDSIKNNLIAADFSQLEKCVSESDLVFESCFEDISIKKDVASRVADSLKETAISCTGTSGLSISEIALCYPERLRGSFFGVHMFNPPYSVSLCELISTEYTDQEKLSELKEYLSKCLYRTVVEVKDSPAFLGNRIGFQFINEALQYAEKYKDNGGIDYIDAILGTFTGRAMPPLATSNFVGLDVHKAIVENIYQHTNDFAHDTFVLPGFVDELINQKKLGVKTGRGLYQTIKYENGIRRKTVYDINTGQYRDVIPYAFPFAEKMKDCLEVGDYSLAFKAMIYNSSQEARICLRFLLNYIVYSLSTANDVAYDIGAADNVMATGFNWCPPIALMKALGSIVEMPKLIKQSAPELDRIFDFDKLFYDLTPSKYDYRRYFKTGRKKL